LVLHICILPLIFSQTIATPSTNALYLRAIHGGKTKNDKIDSYKIALLLKEGTFPVAYPYQQEWRATRDLLRRRMYISRRSGELVAHIQNTNTQ